MTRTYLERTTLVDKLRRRFERRLCVVRGGPGFGKSVLLEQLLADADSQVHGEEFLIACTPDLATPSALSARLRAAIGVEGPSTNDPTVEAKVIADAAALASPRHISILLDGVEKIVGSPSEALLVACIDALPSNVHFSIAGRVVPPTLPIARLLAYGEMILIEEDELAFSASEWERFADDRGLPIGSPVTWPALAELTAAGGARFVRSYLLSEVVAGLDDDQRTLLGSVIAAEGADDEFASALMGRHVDVRAELAPIPLVRIDHEGWARPSDFWNEALPDLLSRDQRQLALRTVASLHAARGTHALAARLLVTATEWAAAGDVIADALSSQPPTIGLDMLGGWLARVPAEHQLHPGWRLASILMSYEQSLRVARVALESLESTIPPESPALHVTVLFHLGTIARRQGDLDALESVGVRLARLANAGNVRAGAVRATVLGFVEQIYGRTESGLALLGDVDPFGLSVEQRSHVAMMRGNHHLLAGRTERALEAYEEAGAAGGTVRLLADELAATATWAGGDALGALERQRRCLIDAQRHGLSGRAAQFRAMLAAQLAMIGQLPEAALLLDAVEEASGIANADAETALLTRVAKALLAAGVKDFERARQLVDELPDPNGSLQRASFMAAGPVAVLGSPENRQRWESCPAGLVQRALGVASDLSGSGFSTLAPTWVSNLRTESSTTEEKAPFGESNPTIASTDGDQATWVLNVLGPVELTTQRTQNSSTSWRRGRVKELAVALVMFGELTRDRLAAMIWPDTAADAALGNLRVQVSHLADALEPGRPRGVLPSALLSRGSTLALSPGVTTDLAQFRRARASADSAERSGDASTALDTLLNAISFVRGDLAEDLSAGWLDDLRFEFTRELIAVALRAGELAISFERADDAASLATLVLRHDEYNERAAVIRATALRTLGDHAGATAVIRSAIDRCEDIGVPVSPATKSLARLLAVDVLG